MTLKNTDRDPTLIATVTSDFVFRGFMAQSPRFPVSGRFRVTALLALRVQLCSTKCRQDYTAKCRQDYTAPLPLGSSPGEKVRVRERALLGKKTRTMFPLAP